MQARPPPAGSRGEAAAGPASIPHILSTSSTMLGVCMTVLSLTKLDDDPLPYWFIDKLVAIAAVLFLVSCVCSFLSLRGFGETPRLERHAEWVFMTGVTMLAIAAVTLAFIVH
ncbi:MAG TPA: hypothetical protein PJ986_09320 [Gammaproteobacteria bacterium]|nr:hypothetical protein [Gammaproteobacteria bacterium]